MNFWTCERIARSIGCSAQQIKRYCDLGKIPCYKSSNDNVQSVYSYRIYEVDLLHFFQCETLEDFIKVQYR